MIRCISIFGPTASGKSALAIEMAKAFNGVIISADSMQIYRGMDIGTAKPSKEELSIVPHKMIDICEPNVRFSVYDYKASAEEEIIRAARCGKLPIIVGGTGLYLDSIFFNTNFGEFEIDPTIHDTLTSRAENGEGELLLSELHEIDPEAAKPLCQNDLKRIVRALEVFHSTGKTLSEYKKESHLNKSAFDVCKIFLTFQNRQNLYERINQRVDQMINQGLVDETRRLYISGVFNQKTASQAIGYKELLPHINSGVPLETCTEILKQKTRNYAKRQITWFKRYQDAHFIQMDTDPDPTETARLIITKFLKEDTK